MRKTDIVKQELVFIDGRQFTAAFEPDLEDGGYTVTCKQIPAAIPQGEKIQEALDNSLDALEVCRETEAKLRRA